MTFKRLSISISFIIFIIYGGLILSLFYYYNGKVFFDALISNRTLFSMPPPRKCKIS